MRGIKKYEFKPDYLVIPGESVRDAIEYLDMSNKDFAQRMGLTEQSLSRILKGEQPITYETAVKLELVTGTSCEFWANLEANYQKQMQIQKSNDRLNQYSEWLKKLPIKELVSRGYIEKSENTAVQTMRVLSFFQTSSINSFNDYLNSTKAAARGTAAFTTDAISAVSYIYMGLRDAQKIQVEPYDKKRFEAVLKQVKALTHDLHKDFACDLQRLFALAGIALVYVPPIKGLHFSGLSKWISPTKAMIIMNIRGKREDRFWFSLFHEAAHILLHSKKQIFISDSTPDDEFEQEADQFAADFLIPESFNARIASVQTQQEIVAIADELGIAPGIVVGRYHHLTKKWQAYTQLIRKLEWKHDSD